MTDSPAAGDRSPSEKEGSKGLHQGYALLKEGKFSEAIACFEDEITKNSSSEAACIGLGQARQQLGNLEGSLEAYDAAIRCNGANAHSRLCRASVHLAQDDHSAALKDLDEALRLDPELSQGYEYRAFIWFRERNWEQASEDYRRFTELEPHIGYGFSNLGSALQSSGRFEEAKEAFAKAVLLEPASAPAMQALAQLQMQMGNSLEAQVTIDALNGLESNSDMPRQTRTLITSLLQKHFAPHTSDDLRITERSFPFRMRADLQRAVDAKFSSGIQVEHFSGVQTEYRHEGINFSSLLIPNPHDPGLCSPPSYEEIDIGEAEPLRCLKNGMWLITESSTRYAVLFSAGREHGMPSGLKLEIAVVNDEEGERISKEFFRLLEDSVKRSESYRGKVLSFETSAGYMGASVGLTVHKLHTVSREEVILPELTLELLERNVLGFTRQRTRLAELGLPIKKGLLFYGPPGTGKTHTIHFLIRALEGHTTFLIAAEQAGHLAEYMTLARLLQPSLVVIEDADLIAKARVTTNGICEHVLLHQLLNEMDGLRADAEVLIVLTTNRPEALESALTARPGRIDQAIEFPLPDEAGRRKLIKLYARSLEVPAEVLEIAVRKTQGVSASFLKELMRRSAQFLIERGTEKAELTESDLRLALEELITSGGSLNRKLLGFSGEA